MIVSPSSRAIPHLGGAVGAAGVIGMGQACLEAMLMHGGDNGLVIGGDPDLLRAAFGGLLRNPHHHWFSANGQQRFARQSRGGETGGDDDVKVQHC